MSFTGTDTEILKGIRNALQKIAKEGIKIEIKKIDQNIIYKLGSVEENQPVSEKVLNETIKKIKENKNENF